MKGGGNNMIQTFISKPFWQTPLARWPSFFEDQDWTLPTLFQDGLTLSEDEKNIYVEAAVPGVDSKNIEVTFDKGILWIRGEAKEEEKKRTFYRKASRSFSYRTTLPGAVEKGTEPEAESKNGVIQVTFKKVPTAEPKKIKIKA